MLKKLLYLIMAMFALVILPATFSPQANAIGAYSGGPWPDAFRDTPLMQVYTFVEVRPENCRLAVQIVDCPKNKITEWCQTQDGKMHKFREDSLRPIDRAQGCKTY